MEVVEQLGQGVVSIRSRPGGREEPDTRGFDDAENQVSIRSRPGGREELPALGRHAAGSVFQSAPDPEVGRNWPDQARSEPPRLVSIRSRPGGREEPVTTGADGDGIDGFNPLPTRRSGGTR